MNKFLEAKEKKGVSYSDIATGIGEPASYRTAIASIFSMKRCASLNLLEKIGRYLELSQMDIKKAYLEQRIKWTEKELEKYKNELKALKSVK